MPSSQWQNQVIGYHQKFTDMSVNSRHVTSNIFVTAACPSKAHHMEQNKVCSKPRLGNSGSKVGEHPFGDGRSICAGNLICYFVTCCSEDKTCINSCYFLLVELLNDKSWRLQDLFCYFDRRCIFVNGNRQQ